jgi:hypothetical protein
VNPAQQILAICGNYDSVVYGRALSCVIIGLAPASGAPMMILSIRIEHALDVAI